MRRLLYTLVTVLLLANMAPASACRELKGPPYETFIAMASSVFIARIVRTEEAGHIRPLDHLPPEPVIEATFRVIRVVEGQPPPSGKVRAYARTYCNVELLAGQDYAIFADKDHFVRGHNDGTTHILAIQDVDVEDLDAKSLPGLLRKQRELKMKRSFEEIRALQQGKAGECWIPREQLSDEQAMANAATVFAGRLVATEEIGSAGSSDPEPAIEATFRVIEVLKGQAPPGGKARTSLARSACIQLLPGNDFIVYLDSQNVIRAERTYMLRFGRYEDSHTQSHLQTLRELGKK